MQYMRTLQPCYLNICIALGIWRCLKACRRRCVNTMTFYIWTGTIDSHILSSPETNSSQILRRHCICIWQYSLFSKEPSCFKINTVAIRVLLKISSELITCLNLSRGYWTILEQGNSACEISPKPCCAFAVHTPESGFKERDQLLPTSRGKKKSMLSR